MEALAERCFQLLAHACGNDTSRQDPRKALDAAGTSAGCFLVAVCLGFLLVLIVVLAIAIGALFWVGFVPICLAALFYKKWMEGAPERKIQASVKQGIEAYERGEPWAVAQVHEYAVEEFRNRVAEHRETTIGDSSQWGRARASLMEAASDAQRSAAYWGARLRQEPSNEFAKSQKDVSDQLEAKLATAFEKLEARSVVLRRFYNECDARLAAMDRHNHDLEEFRRLKELSSRADIVIAHAEGTMHGLATAFVAEAQAFADALGGVAAVSITALAGEAPMDNINYFADRIIEGSDRDRAAIEDIERRLAP